MPNLRDIQRRIKSVGNTSQITKAMQLVASAKMRRAQEQALSGRTYLGALAYVFAHLRENIDKDLHPFLLDGKGDRELVLAISPDKGLCGALNTNLYKEIKQNFPANADFITIGKRIDSYLTKTRHNVIARFAIGDPVALIDLKAVFMMIRQEFLSGKYNKVSVAFTRYVNTLVQKPVVEQLLPIREEQLDKLSEMGHQEREGIQTNFTLEPGPQELLAAILPLFVFYDVVQMVFESRASEHSARMVSMKAATENAQDIISDLTLVYNKARQTAITSELTEISSAMKAME